MHCKISQKLPPTQPSQTIIDCSLFDFCFKIMLDHVLTTLLYFTILYSKIAKHGVVFWQNSKMLKYIMNNLIFFYVVHIHIVCMHARFHKESTNTLCPWQKNVVVNKQLFWDKFTFSHKAKLAFWFICILRSWMCLCIYSILCMSRTLFI
jgi:hypothetical protein